MNSSLFNGFQQSSQRWPDRPALAIGTDTWSYASLSELSLRLASAIDGAGPGPLVGILGSRSLTAYRGVLAALALGRGYLPLNPKHPASRLVRAVRATSTRLIVAGREGYGKLPELLAACNGPVTVFLPDETTLPPMWTEIRRDHRPLLGPVIDSLQPAAAALKVRPEALAYVMFTSGSTGEPKGVSVTHANVRSYARYVAGSLAVTPIDRMSQMSDLSFDWSVHDLFPCWEGGACLCVVPEAARFAPASFIRNHEITLWAAVPSSIGIMATLRLVKPGAFPSIRASIFCGEPLAADHAAQWQAATPNGIIENFYGPTETTVAITRYRWPRAGAPATGVVPIGSTFPDQRHRLIDPAGVEVAPGETGELCFAGDQVAAGYWANPAETAVRFTQLPGGDERWYRTGDLAREDEGGCLHFLGRIDEQVKVRGFRVELQEIDHAVRAAAGAALVATVAWPVRHGSAEGIVAFIAGDGAVDEAAILAHCRARLPDYMVPRSIRRVDVLPLSSNGKTDRRALIQRLEEDESDAGSRTA